MPITQDNYQRAEDFIARAKMDPNFDPARLAKMQSELDNFKTVQSQSVPYRDADSPSGPAMRGSVAGYFYEPSTEEFHNALKDRSVREKIGLGDTYRSETNAGQQYLESQVPELAKLSPTDISQLGEHSPEYQAYSNYAYEEAKKKNPNVDRYSDLEVTKNPFKTALGAVVKYGPAAALGAEKTLTLGAGRGAIAQAMATDPAEPGSRAASIGRPKQSASQTAADESVKQKTIQSAKDLESLSPTANTLGQIGAYAIPTAPANSAARGLVDVTGYAARSPLVKALIGGGIGSTVAAGEGALQDVFSNPSISGEELGNNALSRGVYGGALGSAGDLLAQGATKAKSAFEESPRWSPIKNQKDIGGDTNLFTGIQTTPEVRSNVRTANLGRENRTAADIAAQKVAPQIRESLDNQLTKKVTEIGNQVEDYTKSPYGLEEQSAAPAVDRLLGMAEKGTVSMPVSGRVVSANRGAADAIRKNLQEFADFAHVSPEEAQAMAQQHGGKILTPKQADILGLPQETGKVHVVVPGKFNAEALLKKEDQIARNLKYDTKEGGVDNPVLQEMNLAFKEIRDKFKYDAPNGFTERRGPNRPTNEEWQSMQKPAGVDRNTPISELPELNTVKPEASKSSVGAGDTEPPPPAPVRSEPAPVNEIRGNKRYQEPSASEYAKMQNGENVDKSGNGYQRLIDTEDFAPGYRLRANPNEVSNLTKLADDTKSLEAIHKANPGISEDEAVQILNAQKRLFPEETAYKPEFPKEDAERTGWSSPFQRGQDNPFTPERIGIGKHPDWIPNNDLYTSNPPEDIHASEIQSAPPTSGIKEPKRSLFPDTPDQVGVPRKSEMARDNQTPDVGAVKDIVDKTDKAAAGLTPEELDAVHSYTSRKGDKVGTKEWESATKKLTVDTPTVGGALYHGVRLPQEEIDKILKDKSFSINKPTSTSYNKDISSAMAYSRAKRGEPVIFKIPEVDNGVSLASKKLGIAGTNNEKEILLNNKEFEVVSNSKDSDGNLVIELRQKFSNPEQLTAKLDDGTTVHGFSALRRQQHEALKKLEDAKKGTGSATKEGSHRRVLNYKNGEGSPYENAALAEEADKLGIRQQLEEVPATREYPGLRARAWGGGGEGPMNSLKDFMGFRLDPVLSAIAGEGVNPYSPMPNTPAGRIRQYLFQQGVPMRPLLESRGGLAGARYGNEVSDYQEAKKRNAY